MITQKSLKMYLGIPNLPCFAVKNVVEYFYLYFILVYVQENIVVPVRCYLLTAAACWKCHNLHTVMSKDTAALLRLLLSTLPDPS